MYTKPRRRTGFAGVAAIADIAGTIASSSGRATVTPSPRRNVRRGNAILLMIIELSNQEFAASLRRDAFETARSSRWRRSATRIDSPAGPLPRGFLGLRDDRDSRDRGPMQT